MMFTLKMKAVLILFTITLIKLTDGYRNFSSANASFRREAQSNSTDAETQPSFSNGFVASFQDDDGHRSIYHPAHTEKKLPKESPVVSVQPKEVKPKVSEIQRKAIKKLRSKIHREYSKINYNIHMYDHILNAFRNNPAERHTILIDLEEMIHQYDVGRDFAKRGGLQVLRTVFNSTDESLIAASLLVMGSAIQGNPDVQAIAYDLHLDESLRTFLTHKSPVLISRSLYVIASYLRHNPAGQERFFRTGGFMSLIHTLSNADVSLKIKIKVVNIVNDMIIEQKDDMQAIIDPNQKFRFFIQDEFKKSNVCSIIPRFLYETNFDVHEKIVTAMNAMIPICREKYAKRSIYQRIGELIYYYQPDNKSQKLLNGVDVASNIDSELKLVLYNELNILKKNILKIVQEKHDEL